MILHIHVCKTLFAKQPARYDDRRLKEYLLFAECPKDCSHHMIAHTHWPLTRYVKLRDAHAPGMPEAFSPPRIAKKTAIYRSRHASRHVRLARPMMHVGIANPALAGNTIPAFPTHAQPVISRIWQKSLWNGSTTHKYAATFTESRVL